MDRKVLPHTLPDSGGLRVLLRKPGMLCISSMQCGWQLMASATPGSACAHAAGWYFGNWTAAGGLLLWGRGTGCRLPRYGCQNHLAATPASQQDMFCDVAKSKLLGSSLRYVVSPSYRSVGECINTTFTNKCGLIGARAGIPSCISKLYQYGA